MSSSEQHINQKAHDIIERFDFLNFPYLYCEPSWFSVLYGAIDESLILFACEEALRSSFISSNASLELKNLPAAVIVSEFGYLSSMSRSTLETLYKRLSYFTLFVAGDLQILQLDSSMEGDYKVCLARFKKDGLLYRNTIKTILPIIQRTSGLIFGAKIRKMDEHICHAFGLYVLRILISSEVTPYFLKLLSLKSDEQVWAMQQREIDLRGNIKGGVSSVFLRYLQE